MPAAMCESATTVRGAARLRVARQLALDGALAEVACLLAGRGVRLLLIKGPAIARWLYDDPSERSYRDIDLLVAPDRFEAAKRGLAELGFESLEADLRPGEIACAHEVWVRRGKLPALVELHHSLWLVSAPPSLVWERLSRGSRLMEVGGAQVEVPSPAVGALIVGLHAAHHGAEFPKPLRDLRRALERVDEETWQAAAALARELGAVPAFAMGLRLDPGGCELADRLGLHPDGASRSVRLQLSTPPATTWGIERMIVTHGARARLGLLARELVPSPAFMRVWQPLARRGWWGLVLAYLWRPFWLVGSLPRGVRAWLQVARTPSSQAPRR